MGWQAGRPRSTFSKDALPPARHPDASRYVRCVNLRRPTTPKCFFAAWIFGWVTAIYVPSALVAATGLSPVAEGKGFLAAIFAVADEVAPAAKIGFAVILAGLMLTARMLKGSRGMTALATDMVLAVVAMLVMLVALPLGWSRGFGIGLTGTRCAFDATMIYFAGALLSGMVFSISEARCLARTPSLGGGMRGSTMTNSEAGR